MSSISKLIKNERRKKSSQAISPSKMKAEPEFEDSDMQALLDGVIGEDYLKKHTNSSNLSSVIHLTLTIDTTVHSIFELNDHLPNLQHLVLDHSNISSVRDLGVGLRSLTSLSLANCGLSDLDGIGVLFGLQELCLNDNFITDVTPLALHENLKVRAALLLICDVFH